VSDRFDGRVALVTGAGRGIGRAIALALAERGARTALVARTAAELEAVAAEVAATGAEEPPAIVADMGDPTQIAATAQRVAAELGPVDVLCAFAGFEPGPSTMDQVSEEDFRSVIDGNLTGTFLTLKAFVPGMTSRGAGSIITMSSAAGRLPGWSSYAYAASKSAILQLTRRVAQDVGKFGVRVNALAPSAILTRKQEARIPAHIREQVVKEQFVLGRWGTPADCANAALFLASDASSWITGQTTDIAGGKIMI